ncbi:hypothetical protein CH299_27960 [Rhodococcus sp. 14-2686-1-2]|nr:hypothetical protein CH301_27440 [Rhodococcus sp. 15-1189-1-1a]OZF08304.1 hypothetical protein CH299_27960 [Rhodococcus sp. 14-2686-1-2]
MVTAVRLVHRPLLSGPTVVTGVIDAVAEVVDDLDQSRAYAWITLQARTPEVRVIVFAACSEGRPQVPSSRLRSSNCCWKAFQSWARAPVLTVKASKRTVATRAQRCEQFIPSNIGGAREAVAPHNSDGPHGG